MSVETFEDTWDRLVQERELLRQRLLSRALKGEGVRVGDFARLGVEEVFFKDEGTHGASIFRRAGDKPLLGEFSEPGEYEHEKRNAMKLVDELLEQETTWFELDPRNR
jgi:hypothetical protein